MKNFEIFICFVCLLPASWTASDVRYGSYLGTLDENSNNVKGDVYIVTNTKIRMVHFYYDGMGREAYIYVGRNGSPSTSGTRLPDENGRNIKLNGYSNADILLTLPSEISTPVLGWIAVVCVQSGSIYGELTVTPGAVATPTARVIGKFFGNSYGIDSEAVTVINSRKIEIQGLKYDGEAPGAYFLVGSGTPGLTGEKIPNELGSLNKLSAYNNANITLTLPKKYNIHEISYISIYDLADPQNYGHVDIPDNLAVTPYFEDMEVYYGKVLGDFVPQDHDVSGTVYMVDDTHFRIRDFYYDGEAPDAFFWMGTTENVDASGTILADEYGTTSKLGQYEGEDIVIPVPPGMMDRATWLAVWCRTFAANFGYLMLPAQEIAPAPYIIEAGLSRLAHGVRSGRVTVRDTRRIQISALYYDGRGPDAFFWAGGGPRPNSNGWIVPDETGSRNKLKAYNGQTITLTLPSRYTVYDMNYLSLWCRLFTQNFGSVNIPTDINVPPYTAPGVIPKLSNCETMDDRFNVAWEIDGEDIKFEFTGALEDGGYMAFGLSGSDTRSSMVGSDVTVASFYSGTEGARADDYMLSAYAQCSGGLGACPDELNNPAGTEDIDDIEGFTRDGVTTIKFSRKLNTGDTNTDKVYSASAGPVYVVWAMGIHSIDVIVTKHNLVLTDRNTQIDFGRAAADNCEDVQPLVAPAPRDPWTNRKVDGRGDETTFTAVIGPTGPDAHGFHAITDSQGWGIAWYINGQLIPDLILERGTTYTFVIEGGGDAANTARYHPFYITDDSIGGYFRKTDAEKANVINYAGVDENGNPAVGSYGRYCEYTEAEDSLSKTVYSDYLNSLTLNCEEGSPGTFTWTPDEDTPDLVYYQCYTHRYLGYRIQIPFDSSSHLSANMAVTLFIATLIMHTTLNLQN